MRSPVELRLDRSAVPVVAESRNLSRTGMLVFSEGSKPAETSVRFRFSDFGGRATTIWSREAEGGSLLGMRFTTLGRRDLAALDRLLGAAPLSN